MASIFSTKQSFFLFGTLLIIISLVAACSQHPTKNRQSIKTQPPLVEQQLLTTIKNAENLEQGNPLLLSSLYSLANFYHDRKEYDKAAYQYQRALLLKERMSGPNHPDVVAILKQYARVLQDAKRPTQAANLLARADAILAQSNPAASAQ